jgi:hypothetical protein
MVSARNVVVAGCVVLSGCAVFTKERRLTADADRKYRVGKLLVVPLVLTVKSCKSDIDSKAHKQSSLIDLTTKASSTLGTRGYTVLPLAEADEAARTAFEKSLGQKLCDGEPLTTLPDDVKAYVDGAAKQAGATAVLVGGVSRLRWHLKLDTGDQGGMSSNNKGTFNEFTIRAGGALYDVAAGRVVWTETVETTTLANEYPDALNQIFLFGQLRTQDPHDRLFYDFPLSASAPADAQIQ